MARASHRDEVVVADVRWSATRSAPPRPSASFAAGHIPGAVFFDVDRDLAGAAFVGGPGRHPLPAPGAVRTDARGVRGSATRTRWSPTTTSAARYAARLWWMLEATGRRCALLDGGLGAWPGPLETGAGRRRRCDGRSRRDPGRRICSPTPTACGEALHCGARSCIDARVGERYRGETEPIDPVAGHIPGARSAPCTENLADRRQVPRSPDRAARSGSRRSACIDASTVPIAYCGSGVTASLRRLRAAARRARRRAALRGFVVGLGARSGATGGDGAEEP